MRLILEEATSEGKSLVASPLERGNETGNISDDISTIIFSGCEVDPGTKALMGFGIGFLVPKTHSVVPPEGRTDDHETIDDLLMLEKHPGREETTERKPDKRSVVGFGGVSCVDEWNEFFVEKFEERRSLSSSGKFLKTGLLRRIIPFPPSIEIIVRNLV